MREPTTEAGRALLAWFTSDAQPLDGTGRAYILAIEREARAAVLDTDLLAENIQTAIDEALQEVRERVEALPQTECQWADGYASMRLRIAVELDEVLAALTEKFR